MPDGRGAEKASHIALLLMVRGIARADFAHDQARADFAEALAVAGPPATRWSLATSRSTTAPGYAWTATWTKHARCTRKRSRTPAHSVTRTSAPKHTTCWR
jgi:hypothetical protein